MDPVILPLAALITALLADRKHASSSVVGTAGPGILGTLAPDEVVVYRTARTRAESLKIINAVKAGNPASGFRASTHVSLTLPHHGALLKKLQAATRRGAVPIFATPYVSVAAFYRSYTGAGFFLSRVPSGSLIIKAGKRILVLLRGPQVDLPYTWAPPGGALHVDEDGQAGALREASEELGGLPPGLEIVHAITEDRHTRLLGSVSEEVAESWKPDLNWESLEFAWVTWQELLDLPLMSAFAEDLARYAGRIWRDADVAAFQEVAERTAFEPETWALVLPKEAVLWEHPRVQKTEGVLYSLKYPDSEVLVDASKTHRVLWVPPEVIEPIGRRVELLEGRYSRGGGFKGSYRDTDDDIAGAALDAVLDLRVPPLKLGRAFLEVPLALPGIGGVRKGQRALLWDGQIVTLTEARVLRWEDLGGGTGRWQHLRPDEWNPSTDKLFLVARGLVEWAPFGSGLDRMNIDWHMIARPLEKNERVSAEEKLETWKEGRRHIETILTERANKLRRLVGTGRDDRALTEGIEEIENTISGFSPDVLPAQRRQTGFGATVDSLFKVLRHKK